jgi:hypothetical protein
VPGVKSVGDKTGGSREDQEMTDAPLTGALNLELRRLDATARQLADLLEKADPLRRACVLQQLQSINRALGNLASGVHDWGVASESRRNPEEVSPCP